MTDITTSAISHTEALSALASVHADAKAQVKEGLSVMANIESFVLSEFLSVRTKLFGYVPYAISAAIGAGVAAAGFLFL